MSDQSLILTKLEELVESAVYPNGTSQPSIAGVDITIQSGWPIPDSLNTILINNVALIAIYPTKISNAKAVFLRKWKTKSVNTPTLTVVILNNTITVGGIVSVPQHVMSIVNGIAYSYEVLVTDTLTTIASGLAALIPNATSLGAVITITSVYSLNAKIIVKGTISQEVNRMDQFFWLMIFSPTHTVRDLIGQVLSTFFSELISFDLSDGYTCMNWFTKDDINDDLQEERLYKRTIQLKIEYPITVEKQTTVIGYIAPTLNIVNEIS